MTVAQFLVPPPFACAWWRFPALDGNQGRRILALQNNQPPPTVVFICHTEKRVLWTIAFQKGQLIKVPFLSPAPKCVRMIVNGHLRSQRGIVVFPRLWLSSEARPECPFFPPPLPSLLAGIH